MTNQLKMPYCHKTVSYFESKCFQINSKAFMTHQCSFNVKYSQEIFQDFISAIVPSTTNSLHNSLHG